MVIPSDVLNKVWSYVCLSMEGIVGEDSIIQPYTTSSYHPFYVYQITIYCIPPNVVL